MNFSFPIENHRESGQKALLRVDTLATMCLPATSFIRFSFPGNFHFVTVNSVVPVDEEYTTIRFCQMRNRFRVGWMDPLIMQCASRHCALCLSGVCDRVVCSSAPMRLCASTDLGASALRRVLTSPWSMDHQASCTLFIFCNAEQQASRTLQCHTCTSWQAIAPGFSHIARGCRGMKNILGEDKVILEQLRPQDMPAELSVKADAPQLALREMREQYIEAGYAVHPGSRAPNALPRWHTLPLAPHALLAQGAAALASIDAEVVGLPESID